ncbi:MAG: hypothetical protein AAF514_11565 [Verrucomicrobiota bacterium]
MATASPSPRTTQNHRNARFSLVPWLVRLMDGGPLSGRSDPLPIDDEQALTDETIVAIQEIANRGCWRFLARECGWRRLDAPLPRNAGSQSSRRLWEGAAALPALTFSTATVNLILTVFNASRRKTDEAGVVGPTGDQTIRTNGDLILHHLIFRRLNEQPGFKSLLSVQKDWLINPLNAFHQILPYRKGEAALTRWERLTDPDLAPYVPWIGHQRALRWARETENLWEIGLESRLQWLEALTERLTQWATQTEKVERPDLLAFGMPLFKSVQQQRSIALRDFERLTATLSLRERQRYGERWVAFLDLVEPLDRFATGCLDTHPIERSGAEKAFLARWQAMDFKEVVEQIRNLSQEVRPSFS